MSNPKHMIHISRIIVVEYMLIIKNYTKYKKKKIYIKLKFNTTDTKTNYGEQKVISKNIKL